jgi:4-amino-4-deoxy-L-arabinose transferase-like glycosyltransferase
MVEETPCPVCDGHRPLLKSQRGALAVVLVVLAFLLLVVDSLVGKIDPIGLTAFMAAVALAVGYFFKQKGDEAKVAAR